MRPRPLDADGPRRIADYQLIGVLGEGGQGVVYLGEAPGGGRVAIKVLRSGSAFNSATHRRFLREADTARRVAAFCTAQVLDVGTHHDRPYVVSEYVPGMNLAEAVAADGPRTGHALQRLAVTTLTALAAIHRAGVVHRDFKPSNVILGAEGPVVIDFGIAHTDDHSTAGSGLVGTPAYVAPEQIAGEPPSTASDVFSWACTMAYAATGRLAFDGRTIPALLAAITTAEPELSAVPADLRPLLQACLNKNPAARPSADALLRRLTGDAPASDSGARDSRLPHAGDSGPPRAGDGGLPSAAGSGSSQAATQGAAWAAAQGAAAAEGLTREDPGTPGNRGTLEGPGTVGDPGTVGSDGAVGGPDMLTRPARSRTRRWTLGAAAGLTALVVAAVVVVRTGALGSLTGSNAGAAPFTGTLLYSDDFSDRGNWDGYTFNPAAPDDQRTVHGYEIDRGVYSIFSDKSVPYNGALSPVPGADQGSAVERDVMIGATAEVRDGSQGPAVIGLMCRWDDNVPNGYAFLLGLDGQARILRNAQGTNLDVAPPVRLDPPRIGQKVHLQAACRGSGPATRLTFWVDGRKAIETSDPRPIPDSTLSRVGLTARTPEAGGGVITVSFDDFSVYRSP
ncbi:serine/threonine protein kinase [Streptosporangiaceae bacterium NEAU-GS5]|nr:serine/threonine protein kinase [Streptosporangiaceae bacterium NEAU-GS5]